MANYSKYYENIQPPKILAEESAAEMRARQSGVYKEQRDRDITNAAYIYAQRTGLSVDEALSLIKAKDENMRLQTRFAASQETRNTEAQNAALNAGIQLHNIDLTKSGATDEIAKIQSGIAKHYGTEAAKPIFDELNRALTTAKSFQQEELKRSAEERRTKAIERQIEAETPEAKAAVKKAEIKAGIEGQAEAAESLRAIQEAKYPGRATAQEKAAQFKENAQQLQFLKTEEQALRDQLKQKGIKPTERQQMLQQLSSITTQMGDLRRNLYPSMPSQQPSTGEVAAPAMTPAPKDASAPAETAPTATTFSPENPYAEKAIKEQKLSQQKEEKQKLQKKESAILSGWYAAREEEKMAEKYIKNIPSTKSTPGEIFGEEVPLTEKEKADYYEKAKQSLEKAKSKRLYYEARNPQHASINLRTLKGDELDSFKSDYVMPALLEEAGNNPQKAFFIAKQKGYVDDINSFYSEFVGPSLLKEAGNDPEKAFALAKERGYYSE